VLVAGIGRLSEELKIAELAVLKQSMVHYRFGNKSKIWRAATAREGSLFFSNDKPIFGVFILFHVSGRRRGFR